MHVARFSERSGFEGFCSRAMMLVEPWSMAQHIVANTKRSSPLIAVNPVYMHPFTAAKFVSSFAQLYGRKVCHLNMITGTAAATCRGSAMSKQKGEPILEAERIRIGGASTADEHAARQFQGKILHCEQSAIAAAAASRADARISDRWSVRRGASRFGGNRCIMMQMLPPDLE